MTRKHQAARTPPGMSLLSVIGWVFADMLLVLVVIFLATQTGGAVAPTAVSSAPTTPPTMTKPSPSTTTTTVPPGVDSGYVCFRVDTNPTVLIGPDSPQREAHLADIVNRVAVRLTESDLAGRTAGTVLTFGVAESPNDGTNRARIFNRDILPRLAAFHRGGNGPVVANRPFWDGPPTAGAPNGSISVNFYPIVDAQHGPLTAPPVDC